MQKNSIIKRTVSIEKILYFANFIRMKKRGSVAPNIQDIVFPKASFSALTSVFDFYKSQLLPNKNYLIAVSGGPDSMLLAVTLYHFYVQEKRDLQNLIFIHCNHKTRPENTQEAEFVQTVLSGCRVECVTKKTDIAQHTEESLRKRRYQSFAILAKKYKVEGLLLGHNLTDRIETSFLNLLRGAHLKGFLAMSGKEKHHLLPCEVMRPLLHLSKSYIQEICSQAKIPYVRDQTNDDTTTSKRNLLRKQVLPELYHLSHNPSPNANTFQQSLDTLYTSIQNILTPQVSLLHKIPACDLWKASAAYEIHCTKKTWTQELTGQLFQELHLNKSTSQAQIEQITKFLAKAEQGYVYIKGTYFFIAHGKRYIISAPLDFREKSVEKSKKILTL